MLEQFEGMLDALDLSSDLFDYGVQDKKGGNVETVRFCADLKGQYMNCWNNDDVAAPDWALS